jgi:hypothetical protein
MELIDSYTRARILSFLPIEVFRMLKKKINKKTKKNNFAVIGIRDKKNRYNKRILYKNMVFLYNYKKRNPVYIEKWVVKYRFCYECHAPTPTRGCLCDDCYFKRLKAIECHD